MEANQAKQRSDKLAAANGKLALEQGKLANRNGKLADDLKEKLHEIDEKNTKLRNADAAQKRALVSLGVEKRKSDVQTERSNDLAYDASMNMIQNLAENFPDSAQIRELLEQSPAKQRGFERGYWDRMFPKINSHILAGHTRTMTSVAFSPDGKTLVTGSDDGTARIWDVQTGQTIHLLKGHTQGVHGVAFSPDGKTVVTGSRDGTARIWDIRTGHTTLLLKEPAVSIDTFAFSPDGKTIVTGSRDGTVRIWDRHPDTALDGLSSHMR